MVKEVPSNAISRSAIGYGQKTRTYQAQAYSGKKQLEENTAKNENPLAGLEPTTTQLKVARSTD